MPSTPYQLQLKGYVGGYDFDADYVDFTLGKHAGKPVHVLIDSLGGEAGTALSIASAFSQHGQVTVHFRGMNASAATIASLGAAHIVIESSAMYLVHKCSITLSEWRNYNADQLAVRIAELERQRCDLAKIDLNVASLYAAKCRKSRDELLTLMQTGGWLSAEEALAWGFVDEVQEVTPKAQASLTPQVAADLVAAGIPLPPSMAQTTDAGDARRTVTLSEKILSAIASLFSSSNSHTMTHPQLPLLSAALGLADLAAKDGAISLSAEQAAAVESALSQRDSRIASLQERIDALQSSPAAETTHVVDQTAKASHADADDANPYAATLRSARRLLDEIQQ